MPRKSLLLHAEEDKIHSNEIVLKTPKEKLKNWWHYSRIIVLALLAVAIVVVSIVIAVFSRKEPDYKILLMTHTQYPKELVDAMEDFLVTVANDRNGDGQVRVELNNYVLFVDTDNNGDYAMDMYDAASTRFASDVYYGESLIYIFDAASFYRLYDEQMFVYTDGTTPAPDAQDFDRMMVPLKDCQLFSDAFSRHIVNAMYNLSYSEEYIDSLLDPLYVSFRSTAQTQWVDDEKQMDYYNDSWELFQLFLQGRTAN